MRAQQRVGRADLHVRNDDADQGRYSREIGGEIEDVDDQGELLAGYRGLPGRVGSES